MIDGAKVGSKLCELRACLFACFRKHNAQEKGRVRVLARPARVSLRVCTAMRLPTPGRNTRAYGQAHTCTDGRTLMRSWAHYGRTRLRVGVSGHARYASGRTWASRHVIVGAHVHAHARPYTQHAGTQALPRTHYGRTVVVTAHT